MDNYDSGDRGVSPEAVLLYAEIASGRDVPSDHPALAELEAYGLVTPDAQRPGRLSPQDPFHAAARHVEAEVSRTVASLQRLAKLPSALRELVPLHRQGSWFSANGSELLTSSEVSARVAAVAEASTEEVLTAHPDVRDPKRLRRSLTQEEMLIRRGAALKTIYPSGARAREAEREWATSVSGLGAEVRTREPEGIIQMVLFDGRCAFVRPRNTGQEYVWYITDQPIVAVLREIFFVMWEESSPWLGGKRSNQDGMATNEKQRRILYLKCAHGKSYEAIASDLSVSKRTVENHLARLREVLDVPSIEGVYAWWGGSADRGYFMKHERH
ncbi:Sigma-70, region 4 [Streptomyces sp. YIM 121038]|uniref:sigma factor-like helix-turn-helix DNA-binding protein n=1 Tax=Streptomyces sp. YIM 121038 TaxID=2136401 RepID=UPI00116376B8|nr:sigma factor-like helix-turn-helix DNA-binding protein [Streptomyces sp. YIM 121038]QCX75701.1 Sigma-70, region 4 [Streptomyces sp. YIM 121038]